MSKRSKLIIGAGASGTHFICDAVNRSQDEFIAYHEPRFRHPDKSRYTNEQYQDILDNEKVILVNRAAKKKWHILKNVDRYVLFRDCADVVLSLYNRWGKFDEENIDNLKKDMEMVEEALENGASMISFTKMTTDEKYLEDMIEELTGVRKNEVEISMKINHNKRTHASRFSDLPERTILYFLNRCGDLNEKLKKYEEGT